MNKLSFFSIGDWGYRCQKQQALSNTMANIARYIKPSFIVALGDNFYENGVDSVNDPKWKTHYLDIFSQASLNCRWYAILGNHDYLGNPESQIEYYKINSKGKWIMPNRFYNRIWTIPNSPCTVEIVFIDTVILCPRESYTFLPMIDEFHEYDPHYYYVSDFQTKAKIQWSWLERTLKQSTADYLIVAGHYPTYSAGEHGDTGELVEHLAPLLEKYNVSMYLCGHDHIMQYTTIRGVVYVINGSSTRNGHVKLKKGVEFSNETNGFVVHEATTEFLYTTFYNIRGQAVFRRALLPRKK